MEVIGLENPHVLIIKNFITDEEINTILKSIKNCPEQQWNIDAENKRLFLQSRIDAGIEPKESMDKFLKDIWNGMTLLLTFPEKAVVNYPSLPYELLSKIKLRMKKATEDYFKEEVITQLDGIHRWRVGRYQEPHLDYFLDEEDHDFEMLASHGLTIEKINSWKNIFFDKHYSSLLYFNDDFVGGELYMPQHNFEIKPEPGMLICFKGDENHLHGVKMVTEGVRYTWSLFWTSKEWALKNPDRIQKGLL